MVANLPNRTYLLVLHYLMAEYWRFVRELKHRSPRLPLWSAQAYLLSPTARARHQTDAAFLAELGAAVPAAPARLDGRALASSVHRLKMMCATLRYCYVSGYEIASLQFDERRLLVSSPDTPPFAVSAGPVSPGCRTCALSGQPTDWLSLERWVALKQILNAGDSGSQIEPIRFHSHMAPALCALGATQTDDGLWLPPPTWPVDELRDYVRANWRLFTRRRDVSRKPPAPRHT